MRGNILDKTYLSLLSPIDKMMISNLHISQAYSDILILNRSKQHVCYFVDLTPGPGGLVSQLIHLQPTWNYIINLPCDHTLNIDCTSLPNNPYSQFHRFNNYDEYALDMNKYAKFTKRPETIRYILPLDNTLDILDPELDIPTVSQDLFPRTDGRTRYLFNIDLPHSNFIGARDYQQHIIDESFIQYWQSACFVLYMLRQQQHGVIMSVPKRGLIDILTCSPTSYKLADMVSDIRHTLQMFEFLDVSTNVILIVNNVGRMKPGLKCTNQFILTTYDKIKKKLVTSEQVIKQFIKHQKPRTPTNLNEQFMRDKIDVIVKLHQLTGTSSQ